MSSTATQFLDGITANNGTTVWSSTTPTTGYCVALKAYEVILSNPTAEELRDYLFTHLGIRDGVGAWKENGMVYLDVIVHVQDFNEAIELGRAEQQLAIYCIHDSEVISCNE